MEICTMTGIGTKRRWKEELKQRLCHLRKRTTTQDLFSKLDFFLLAQKETFLLTLAARGGEFAELII
jgi:hypothetical protein